MLFCVWISDEALILVFDTSLLDVLTLNEKPHLVLDRIILGVRLSDETLVLVFDINFYSSVFDIRWNTPCRVWLNNIRGLDIRWNTHSRVWYYITFRCLNIEWNTPSRVWLNKTRSLDIRRNTNSSFKYFISSVLGYQMKHPIPCLI